MQFGIVLNQYFEPPARPVWAELVEQAQAAESLGYDLVVLGEHHLHPVGFHEQLTTLAALAVLTQRIRLCTAGFVLPYYHPLFLAEALANVDLISQGRVICGTVLGYRPEELAAFAVASEQRVSRFVETLQVMRGLWRGTLKDHDGDYYHIHGATPLALVQPGGPPVWVGAHAPAAIRRAAQLADGWIASYNAGMEELEKTIALYRQTCAEQPAPAAGHVALVREGFVHESAEQARRVIEKPVMAQYAAYAVWKQGSLDEDKYRNTAFEAVTHRMILGSPAECIEQIHAYQQLGIDSLLMVFQQPGIPQAETLACMRRFALEVMPHFAPQEAK